MLANLIRSDTMELLFSRYAAKLLFSDQSPHFGLSSQTTGRIMQFGGQCSFALEVVSFLSFSLEVGLQFSKIFLEAAAITGAGSIRFLSEQ